MFQPTSRSVVVRSDEVKVSVVTVDATRRRVDCDLSTVSDSMSVVAVEQQRDAWICSESGLPLRKGDAVGVDGAWSLVGGPATAFASDTVGCADFAGGGGGGEGLPLWWRPTVLAGEVAVGVTSLAVEL